MAALGERYSLTVDPRATIADLSLGERQRVEIVKMLYRDVDVLFLDEPTAVLTPQEVESLFRILRAIAAEGRSVVLITHKLGEVMAVADRVTVMRGARVVASARYRRHSNPRPGAADGRSRRGSGAAARSTTSAGGARARGGRPVPGRSPRAARIEHVDLVVRAGEIVGVAGVAGNGQLQLAETLAGMRSPSAGRIVVNGVDMTGAGTAGGAGRGPRYVPEDRLGTGLAPGPLDRRQSSAHRPRPLVAVAAARSRKRSRS